MTDKRSFTSIVVFFVVIAVFVFVWLFFVAPMFQEKEKLVRSENAALVKDIAEIESMGGSLETLETIISDTKESIADRLYARAETAGDAVARIESICAELGYSPSKIALSPVTKLSPAGMYTPALYSVDVNFLIESTAEAGPAVIRGIEKHPSADFEITGFVYRSFLPEGMEAAYTGEWIFTATLYYYE